MLKFSFVVIVTTKIRSEAPCFAVMRIFVD